MKRQNDSEYIVSLAMLSRMSSHYQLKVIPIIHNTNHNSIICQRNVGVIRGFHNLLGALNVLKFARPLSTLSDASLVSLFPLSLYVCFVGMNQQDTIKALAPTVKYGCCTTFIINGKPACVGFLSRSLLFSAALLRSTPR